MQIRFPLHSLLICLFLSGCGLQDHDRSEISEVLSENAEKSVRVPIGTGGRGTFRLPSHFYSENEGPDTLFIMPRKDDPEGPISMRVSWIRDLDQDGFTEEMTHEFLQGLPGGSEIKEVGGNLIISSEQIDYEDEDNPQIRWHLRHFTIVSDGLVFNITVGALKGREEEPQCDELLNALPSLMASLSRSS